MAWGYGSYLWSTAGQGGLNTCKYFRCKQDFSHTRFTLYNALRYLTRSFLGEPQMIETIDRLSHTVTRYPKVR